MNQKKSKALLAHSRPLPERTLTAAQTSRLKFEVHARLDQVLATLRARANGQFKYSLRTNVPKGILTPVEVIDNAIRQGFVSAATQFNDCGIEPSIQLAAELLEDVNAHAEAAPLFVAIKAWRNS